MELYEQYMERQRAGITTNEHGNLSEPVVTEDLQIRHQYHRRGHGFDKGGCLGCRSRGLGYGECEWGGLSKISPTIEGSGGGGQVSPQEILMDTLRYLERTKPDILTALGEFFTN